MTEASGIFRHLYFLLRGNLTIFNNIKGCDQIICYNTSAQSNYWQTQTGALSSSKLSALRPLSLRASNTYWVVRVITAAATTQAQPLTVCSHKCGKIIRIIDPQHKTSCLPSHRRRNQWLYKLVISAEPLAWYYQCCAPTPASIGSCYGASGYQQTLKT